MILLQNLVVDSDFYIYTHNNTSQHKYCGNLQNFLKLRANSKLSFLKEALPTSKINISGAFCPIEQIFNAIEQRFDRLEIEVGDLRVDLGGKMDAILRQITRTNEG